MRLVLICALSILSFIAQGQGIINYIAKYSFEANFNDSTTTYNGTGNATISSVQFHDRGRFLRYLMAGMILLGWG